MKANWDVGSGYVLLSGLSGDVLVMDEELRRLFLELCQRDGSAEKLRIYLGTEWDHSSEYIDGIEDGTRDALKFLGISGLLESEPPDGD